MNQKNIIECVIFYTLPLLFLISCSAILLWANSFLAFLFFILLTGSTLYLCLKKHPLRFVSLALCLCFTFMTAYIHLILAKKNSLKRLYTKQHQLIDLECDVLESSVGQHKKSILIADHSHKSHRFLLKTSQKLSYGDHIKNKGANPITRTFTKPRGF